MRKAREWRQAAKRLAVCKFSVFMEDLEDLLQSIRKNVQDTTRGHRMYICICSMKNEVISNTTFESVFDQNAVTKEPPNPFNWHNAHRFLTVACG